MCFIWKMVEINPQNCLVLSKHSTETSNKYLSDEQVFNKAASASVQWYKSSERMTVVSVWNRLSLTQGSLCLYLSAGRLLASFRSGFSHLVPDVNSAVYMRRLKASGAVLWERESQRNWGGRGTFWDKWMCYIYRHQWLFDLLANPTRCQGTVKRISLQV